MQPAKLLLVAATIAVGASCADTKIRVEDYAQSCEANADCAFAYFGDACGGCLAELHPVNVDEIEAIDADVAAAGETCAPWSDRYRVECVVPVPTIRPVCDDGTCVEGPSDGEPCAPEDARLCRGGDA